MNMNKAKSIEFDDVQTPRLMEMMDDIKDKIAPICDKMFELSVQDTSYPTSIKSEIYSEINYQKTSSNITSAQNTQYSTNSGTSEKYEINDENDKSDLTEKSEIINNEVFQSVSFGNELIDKNINVSSNATIEIEEEEERKRDNRNQQKVLENKESYDARMYLYGNNNNSSENKAKNQTMYKDTFMLPNNNNLNAEINNNNNNANIGNNNTSNNNVDGKSYEMNDEKFVQRFIYSDDANSRYSKYENMKEQNETIINQMPIINEDQMIRMQCQEAFYNNSARIHMQNYSQNKLNSNINYKNNQISNQNYNNLNDINQLISQNSINRQENLMCSSQDMNSMIQSVEDYRGMPMSTKEVHCVNQTNTVKNGENHNNNYMYDNINNNVSLPNMMNIGYNVMSNLVEMNNGNNLSNSNTIKPINNINPTNNNMSSSESHMHISMDHSIHNEQEYIGEMYREHMKRRYEAISRFRALVDVVSETGTLSEIEDNLDFIYAQYSKRHIPNGDQNNYYSMPYYQQMNNGSNFLLQSIKRGRGRPRKISLPNDEIIKRNRGRPRKDSNSINIPIAIDGVSSGSDNDTPDFKRGRGRPRKNILMGEPQIKRPRGRPRKERSNDNLLLIKRPRGRPRKMLGDLDPLINQAHQMSLGPSHLMNIESGVHGSFGMDSETMFKAMKQAMLQHHNTPIETGETSET